MPLSKTSIIKKLHKYYHHIRNSNRIVIFRHAYGILPANEGFNDLAEYLFKHKKHRSGRYIIHHEAYDTTGAAERVGLDSTNISWHYADDYWIPKPERRSGLSDIDNFNEIIDKYSILELIIDG